MFTKWDTWRKLHPNSKVLSSGRGGFLASTRDPYESYYRSADTGIIPTRLSDNRIYPKEFVIGLVLNDKAKAYPFSVLSRQPVLNDAFQGVPLLVVFDGESTTGMVFRRKVEGKALSFKQAKKSGLFLSDDSTNSLWEGLTATAIQGPFKDKRLEPLPSTPSFWFGWVDHYPKTELFLLSR